MKCNVKIQSFAKKPPPSSSRLRRGIPVHKVFLKLQKFRHLGNCSAYVLGYEKPTKINYNLTFKYILKKHVRNLIEYIYFLKFWCFGKVVNVNTMKTNLDFKHFTINLCVKRGKTFIQVSSER